MVVANALLLLIGGSLLTWERYSQEAASLVPFFASAFYASLLHAGLKRKLEDRTLLNLWLTLGLFALAAALPMALGAKSIVCAWMAIYLAMKTLSEREQSKYLNGISLFLLLGALVRFLGWDQVPNFLEPETYNASYFFTRLCSLGALSGGFWIAVRIERKLELRKLWVVLGTASLFCYLSAELFWLLRFELPDAVPGGISVLWGCYALALVVAGLMKHSVGARRAGLTLFVVTALKVFLFDLSRVESLYRILAFFLLGMALLGGHSLTSEPNAFLRSKGPMIWRIRKVNLLLIALSICGYCIASGDFRGELPLKRPLIPLVADELQIGEIRFDSLLYREIDDPSSHIRLYDNDDIEVPFQVTKAMRISGSRTTWQPACSRIRSFVQDEDHAMLTVANPDREWISRLRLITPDRNFRKQITVEAGDGKQNWKQIAGPLPFCDYSSQVDLLQDTADFEPNNAPFFRIAIANYQESTPDAEIRVTDPGDGNTRTERTWRERRMRIDRVTLLQAKTEPTYQPIRQNWPLRTTMRQKGSRTVIDLHSDREPLTLLTLSSATPDYHRHVILYCCDETGKKLRELARGSISSLNDDKNRQLPIPESRYAHYRLEIENGDNQPLESLCVEACGPIHLIQFLTRDTPQNLCYGNALPTPRYDIATALSRISPHSVTGFALGKPAKNPVCQDTLKLDSPLFLGGVLVLLSGVLGWFLWTGMKKMQE